MGMVFYPLAKGRLERVETRKIGNGIREAEVKEFWTLTLSFCPFFRYASLFFIAGIDSEDNELIALEVIHRYVEVLDKWFVAVCELDIIFAFQQAYTILDEVLIGGELQWNFNYFYLHYSDLRLYCLSWTDELAIHFSRPSTNSLITTLVSFFFSFLFFSFPSLSLSLSLSLFLSPPSPLFRCCRWNAGVLQENDFKHTEKNGRDRKARRANCCQQCLHIFVK